MRISTEYMTLSLPEELGEEIECKVSFHPDNSGIGSYEFWGFCGYDAGVDCLEIDDIEPQFTDQSNELQDQITLYVVDHFDILCEEAGIKLDELKDNDY